MHCLEAANNVIAYLGLMVQIAATMSMIAFVLVNPATIVARALMAMGI